MRKIIAFAVMAFLSLPAHAEYIKTAPVTLDNIPGGPLGVTNGGTNADNIGDAIENLSGIINASACGESSAPDWCSGSDVGAWINAAFTEAASANIGTVIINANESYVLTTPIVKPTNMVLDGQNSTITVEDADLLFAIRIGTLNQIVPTKEGGIKNLYLIGPDGTATGTTYGIYEGTDPSGIISPSNTYSAIQIIENVEIRGFKAAYSHGSNAWNTVFLNFRAHSNYDGIYVPSGISNAGENMQLTNSVLYGNINCGLNINYVSSEEWTVYGGSMDYNEGPNICGSAGVLKLYGAHIEDDKAPLIELTSSTERSMVRSYASNFVVTGSGGPYNGYVYSSNTSNLFLFDGDTLYRSPTVSYLLYTNAAASTKLIARALENAPTLTDALTNSFTEHTPISINSAPDQAIPTMRLGRKASSSYTVNEVLRIYNNYTSGASNQPSILFTNNFTAADPLTTTDSTWSLGAGVTDSKFYLKGKHGSNDLITALTVTGSGYLGIGTTSPSAGLDNYYGKMLVRGGTPPTISSCGTSPTISGSDSSFTLNMGSGTLTSCVVLFGATWTIAPKVCSLVPMNATAAAWGTTGAYVSAISTTQLTITGTNLTSANYGVHCF